jgi:hypothetical protein
VAEPADVHVDRAAVGGEVALPDLAHQIGPGEHGRRVRRQEGEQLELLERQRDLGPVHPDAALVVVEQQAGPPARGPLASGRGRKRADRAGRGNGVADDRHGRAGTGNGDHREQRPVRLLPEQGMRDLGRPGAVLGLWPGVRAAKQLRSDLHVPRHLLHVRRSSHIAY